MFKQLKIDLKFFGEQTRNIPLVLKSFLNSLKTSHCLPVSYSYLPPLKVYLHFSSYHIIIYEDLSSMLVRSVSIV